jgi:hypothetical protein
MSFNGTVRCGYCYEKGHNKRSCPQLKEYCLKNPDTYTARSIESKKAYYKKRTCSYCDEGGHNRATCEALISDVKIFNEINDLYRSEITLWAEANGVGPGALVEIPEVYVSGGGYCHNVLGIITKISWDTCLASDSHAKEDVIQVTLLGELSGKRVDLPLPAVEEDSYKGPSPWASSWSATYNAAKLLSPVTASLGPVPFANCVVSKQDVKEVFKGYSHRNRYGGLPAPLNNCIRYWNDLAPVNGLTPYNPETGVPVSE